MSAIIRPDSGIYDYLRQLNKAVVPDDSAHIEWCRSYFENHLWRFAEDLVIVDDIVPAGAEILEVGSAPPFVTAALASRGRPVTGVDVDPSRFSNTIRELGLSVHQCDIERDVLPFEDESFEAILCNEVFEHLRINPRWTLSEIRRVLRVGGTLMLSTPNLASVRGIARLLLKGQAWAVSADPFTEYSKLDSLGHMGHVREYTPKEVSDFLSRCGFNVQEVVFRGRGSVSHPAERVAVSLLPNSYLPYFSLIATRQ